MNRHTRGFTIVELLIVIVVIGILAAITIVTFSGIQSRAENNKTVSAVGAYAKALTVYAALPENGRYPIASYPCLGPNPATPARCANMTDSTNPCFSAGTTVTKADFEIEMKKAITNIPQPSSQSMNCSGKMYSGAYYNSDAGTYAEITYYLKGNVPCPSIGGLGQPGRNQANDTTVCIAALPSL
ncbi:MAG: prepilin-type N-terminal cleavage/methylation domain-containing protein [Chloroflexi bacterium]|nr:MAG: prepilin-type N-terminal cleavage/methylation domain-containing protein [Chloroflexota bacterium]